MQEITATVVVPLLPPFFDKALVALRLNVSAIVDPGSGYFQFPMGTMSGESETAAKMVLSQYGVKMDTKRILYFGESLQMEVSGQLLTYHQFGYMLKVNEPLIKADLRFSPWYEWPLDWCFLRDNLMLPLHGRAARTVAEYTSKIRKRYVALQELFQLPDRKIAHITVGVAALQFLAAQEHWEVRVRRSVTKMGKKAQGYWHEVPVFKHMRISPSAIMVNMAGDPVDSSVIL